MMHVHEKKSFWKGINVFLMYCFLLLDLYVCVVLCLELRNIYSVGGVTHYK